MATSRDPAAVGPDREAELDDGTMPFFEHLRELRDRLRNAAIFFVVGVIGCWFVSEDIYVWLRAPIDAAWLSHQDVLGAVLGAIGHCPKLLADPRASRDRRQRSHAERGTLPR